MRSGRDYWFTAGEAKAAKLIDQVIPAPRRAFAPLAVAGGANDADGPLLDLAADLVSRLEGAAKDQAGFRAELARRLGIK
jgi:hypothetical protein